MGAFGKRDDGYGGMCPFRLERRSSPRISIQADDDDTRNSGTYQVLPNVLLPFCSARRKN
jgi:hypothetical protein